jgi:CubicO group peptidase (beta-lactamase class C family)
MKIRLAVLALLLSLLSSFPFCAAQIPPAEDAELAARIDGYVKPYVDSGNFSGVVLVARGERKLLERAYGMANQELGVRNAPETRFHIASVSKSFTAAAILLLEQQGKLKVTDPLTKWIPDYPQGQKITVHHLLTHTSGIPNVNSFPDYDEKSRSPHTLEEVISWFKLKPLQTEPGSKYSYSNSNYNLLAYIIEKTSGQSYGEFMASNIFAPLRLQDTGHDGNPATIIPRRASGYMPAGADQVENAPALDWSNKTGNGSLYSTASDLYSWARALTTDALLREATRKKMFTEHVDGTGYGWFIRSKAKRVSVAINGRAPGFSANLERFPESDTYIVLVSNLYTSITQSMAPDLAAIVFGEKREPQVPAAPVQVAPKLLDIYAGDYEFGADYPFNPVKQVRIERRGNWLVLVAGGGGGSSFLLARGENDFLDRTYGGVVRFEQDGNGKAIAFVWDFGNIGKFRAVRK